MIVGTPVNFRKILLDCWFAIASLLVLAMYLYMAILANTDLASGRFALFMDERITFDGVKRILHSSGFVQFLTSVLDGGDQRYGRSLWNSIAIFSVIPERLFGDSGQIIATRMLQVAFIVASYCVLSFGILRSWFLRFVLLVAMLSMPFSDYFMTMPKPEPLQLLFLAMFSYFFIKKNGDFSWYWIFAGLAFGTKISTLPVVLVFLSVSLAARVKTNSFESYKKSLFNAAIAFVIGLAIAVPILAVPVLASACGYFTFRWASRKFGLGSGWRMALAGTGILVVFLVSRRFLKIWFSSTFLNTTHGADQASINALSWLSYFFDSWLVAPYGIGLMLVGTILLYLIFNGIQILKSDGTSVSKKKAAFAVAMAGLALNIAVAMGTKRLWGFYLYPGTVLLIAGTIILIDLNISEAAKAKNRSLVRLNRSAGYFTSLVLLVVSGAYWAPQAIDELEKLSLRTNTEEYTLQYSSYKTYTDFLDRYKIDEERRMRVMLTPSLFPPESNGKFEIVEFWGPFIEWKKEHDIIIFGAINTPRGESTPKDSPSYNSFLIEREGYAAHVAEKGAACKRSPCFIRELELPNGGEVLVLSRTD